jgi:mono/diheme cytochrome c family protein
MLTRESALLAGLLLVSGSGCRQDMHDQPKFRGLRGSTSFADGRSARPAIADTVGRDEPEDDARPALALDRATLLRGQERFDIFCAPCHGRTGNGDGMVVRRGLTHPPALHLERLKDAPAAYLFDAITRGSGSAAPHGFASEIPTRDRWAIVGYVRALQLSQDAPLSEVPSADRARLESETEP